MARGRFYIFNSYLSLRMGILTLMLVNACTSADDGIFKDSPTNKPVGAVEQRDANPQQDQSNKETSSSSSDSGNIQFGSGIDSLLPAGADEISYPILSFTGRGNLDHRGGSAKVLQKISASMDKEKLVVAVQQFLAEGGDNKSDVNKEISKQTGDTVYIRASGPQDSSSLTSSADDPTFLIFSRSFEDRRSGKVRSFLVSTGDALPVLIVPAAETRYEALLSAPMQYQSQLSSNGQTFTIRSTISGRKISEESFQVTIDMQIPEDKNGELYGILPMAKTTDYGVDLKARRITSISTRGTYNDKNSNKARSVNIAFKLCQSVKDGKIELQNTCT